jgi:cell fate regulator YaaT (PSP1 superfamily)
MYKVLVRVYSWENPRLYWADSILEPGDKVIVAADFNNELAVLEHGDIRTDEEPSERIQRVATARDKKVFLEYEAKKIEYLEVCREEIKKLGLEIKLVDARSSLDGKQVMFVFTADGRVDFRELVKNLSKILRKSIRMKQIGSRDEARKLGGYGICGRELCCVRFRGSIPSITTDMARVQQIAHRGTERISGLCGRLMCCLAYESEQYKQMIEGMPELHSFVSTPEGKGTVVEINAITQEIKVKLESGKYLAVKKEDIK